MLMNKETMELTHTIFATDGIDKFSFSSATTTDGITLGKEYVMEYQIEVDGVPLPKTTTFVRKGMDLIKGLSTIKGIVIDNEKDIKKFGLLPLVKDLSKAVVVIYSTLKIKGDTNKVKSELREYCGFKEIYKALKRSSSKEFIEDAISAYMWCQFSNEEKSRNKVTVIHSSATAEDLTFVDATEYFYQNTLHRIYGGDINVAAKDIAKNGVLNIEFSCVDPQTFKSDR